MKLAPSIALLCVLLGLGISARAGDPLATFNEAFRQTYAKAKADSLARGGPVLLLSGDQLLLYRNHAKVAEATVRPPLYHQLKAVAHMPLALHLLFTTQGGPSRDQVAGLRKLAGAARADLASWAPPPLLAGQQRILDACLDLLDQQLRRGGPDPGSLAAFALAMGPLVLANADQAAALELEALDREVARFRKGLAPGEWDALQVVVIGSHMAREGEVAMQYFSRLLAEPEEGHRIIFAESLWQPKDALDLLATHRVDLGEGAAFFHDPMRMHRDVLADGARQWLDHHLPPAPVH
jgi:hypothetical protein